MLEAARAHFSTSDIAIFSAAVADFRPATTAAQKLKKGADLPATSSYTLELTLNPDILATLAARKGATFVAGFAAETENVLANAQAKLSAKNADLIVANDVSDSALGFGSQDNKIWLVDANGTQETAVLDKKELARIILDKITATL
jgi:phosphopantothenoylcysteine decarboxylase/phosphopantothenate--cysteine ligase